MNFTPHCNLKMGEDIRWCTKKGGKCKSPWDDMFRLTIDLSSDYVTATWKGGSRV